MQRAHPSIENRVRCRGFTLIELVMTIVIIGVLAAVSAPLLFGGFRFFESNSVNIDTLTKLRYATERMAREIREVQNNAGTYAFVTMGASTLSFTKNSGNTITFGTSGANLTMTDSGVAGGPYTLTNQLSSVAFAYYQIDGVTTTVLATNVAFVDITLTLGNFSRSTRVALRNQT